MKSGFSGYTWIINLSIWMEDYLEDSSSVLSPADIQSPDLRADQVMERRKNLINFSAALYDK